MPETSMTDDMLLTYDGTPYECILFLESYFSSMREAARGVRTLVEEEGGDTSMWDDALEALDRCVYEVTVRPLKATVPTEFRPDTERNGELVKTAMELYHIVKNGTESTDKG